MGIQSTTLQNNQQFNHAKSNHVRKFYKRIAVAATIAASFAGSSVQSEAGTWNGGSAGWVVGTPGWDVVPNAIGDIATNPITETGTTTQGIVGNVTLGTISLTGNAPASWTITPAAPTATNTITMNQDGIGVGTATISNSNADTGNVNALILSAGSLILADNLLVSNTSGSTAVVGAIQITSTISGTGNLTLNSTAPIGTPVSGAFPGAIRLQGGTNTFAGSVLVQKGLVTFNNAASFGNVANVITLGESGQGDAMLANTNNVSVANPIIVAAGPGSRTLGTLLTTGTGGTFSGSVTLNGNLNLTGAGTTPGVTVSGVISGVGGITKVGTGFVTLSNAANSYAGDTNINAGTLAVSGDAIPAGVGKGNVFLSNGATLQLNATEGVNGLFGDAGTFVKPGAASTLAIGGNSVNSTFSGKLTTGTGAMGLQKIGRGISTLNSSVSNDNTGGTRVNANLGTLQLDYSNLATPTNLLNPATTLQITGGILELKGKTGENVSQTFTGNLRVNFGIATQNEIKWTPNGATGLDLIFAGPNVVRAVGANLNFNLGSAVVKTTGVAGYSVSANGLLNAATTDVASPTNLAGAYATFNANTWATVTGSGAASQIVGLDTSSYADSSTLADAAAYNALTGVTSNVDFTTGSSITFDAPIAVNTFRFNTAGAKTLTLSDAGSGVSVLNGGGILVTSAVGAAPTLITGGKITGISGGASAVLFGVTSTKDLIVHQYNTAADTVINSQIINSGASEATVTTLTKSGPGTLVLSSTANSYTGHTYVGDGRLKMGAVNALPHVAAGGGLVVDAIFDLNGFDTTINGLTISHLGTITNDGAAPATLTLGDNNGTVAVQNAPSHGLTAIVKDGTNPLATLALKKIGTGAWTASSPVTYSGGTTLQGGITTLAISSTGSAGPLGTGTITLNGGTLTTDSTVQRNISNPIQVVGDTIVVGGTTAGSSLLSIDGPITGSATLNATTSSPEYMNYTGDISGFTGTFKIGGASTNNRVHFVGTTTASRDGSQATFDVSPTAGGTTVFRWGSAGNPTMKMGELKGTSANVGILPVDIGSAILEVGHKGTNSTYAGAFSQPGTTVLKVVKVGIGTLTLTGAGGYTNGTDINGGAISVGSVNAIGTVGAISFNGGTLQHTTANTTDYSSRFSNTVGQSYSIDTNTQTVSYATGLTSLAGSFTKLGPGTLNLSGANTYTGNTTVSGGILNVSGSITSSSGNLSVGDGAFVLGGSASVQNTVNTAGTGTIHVQSTGSLTANNLLADFATIDGVATVRANGSAFGASKVETFNISTAGKLDLKDNDLVVGSAANVTVVRDAIKLGKTNNAPSGITSDAALFGSKTGFGYAMGDDPNLSTLLTNSSLLTGQSFDTDSVLVKYTFLGDADLDGDTDLNDLGKWASNFTGDLNNPAVPAKFWTQGDFDYDGDTDLNDLGKWSSNFTGDLNGGAGSLIVYAPGASASAISVLNGMGITVVPEPSTFVLAGVGLAGLAIAARRKKKS